VTHLPAVRLHLLPALLFLLAAAGPGFTQSGCVQALASRGSLAVSLPQAQEVESALGQLLVVNVDGFGYSGPLALAPEFAPVITRLRIGGVIPHYGSTSYERIRRTNRALAGLSDIPLLICSDIVKLHSGARTASFGDGYVGGFLGRYRPMRDDQLATLARLNAFVLTALGINVSLGPTVDSSTQDPRTVERARLTVDALKGYGLQVVLKHFPFLPPSANLHRQSPDIKLPLDQAEDRFAAFRELADSADVVMTTHLLDTAVDDGLVTFSRKWNGLLRDRTGYQGLLMTDGLLMLRNYTDRRAFAGGVPPADFAGMDPAASWAARAILAGHDLVIVEGSAAQTVRVFEGLLAAACGGTSADLALRQRILESSERIVRWKKDREADLRRTVEVSQQDIERVIRLLPGDDANLAAFRFDPASLLRIQARLESTALPR
jgi:beta-glucosidase-like glycosyl hydrolase